MAIGSAWDWLQSMIVHDLAFPTATAKLYNIQIKERLVGNSHSNEYIQGYIQMGERTDSYNCTNGLCSSNSGLLLAVWK